MRISRHIIAKVMGILCALLVAVLVGVAIYDLCSPWPTASQSLEKFGRHYRFCIGMSSESSTTGAAGQTTFESSRQRAFILMRAPVGWPRLVAVSQDQDGRVTIDETAFGFWLWLVVSGGSVWGAWRFCVRPPFKSQTVPQPSNHALRRTQPPRCGCSPRPSWAGLLSLRRGSIADTSC